jgi:hypothetical protein
MQHTTILDPQTLAEETLVEIERSLKTSTSTETDILEALQDHYTTLERNQELYIEYLTEFIDRLKKTQHQDKESLAQLKKQVLKHVLSKEKTK